MQDPPDSARDTGDARSRRGRRTRMASRESAAGKASRAVWPGMEGGRLSPLSGAEVARIHEAVLTILETIGLSGAPDRTVERVVAAGGHVDAGGRLLFPRALVERALAGLRRAPVLHGRRPGHELLLEGSRVHMGTGGAAPLVADLETGAYRSSTLRDLFDAARLADCLPNIHFFSRSLVARDMPDARSLDLNTAYASLAGTSKHVCAAASEAAHVREIADMCYAIACSPERFRERPFLSLNVNHVVPPLRFAPEACGVLEEAAALGIPVHANVFAQVGASCPVTVAGAAAQSTAEALAGMILAWLVNPDAIVIFGPRPMVTDLRTGAMAGGGGEQAVYSAAVTRMARHYGLPDSCIAGATDSKLADAQSGYEKGISVAFAAQSGCNMITQSCGMHAGLMAAAFESYVIDNDMLGSIMSTLRPFEVSEETLSIASIAATVRGEGHFLGAPETLARMESDFEYPSIADRRPAKDWEEAGRPDIREAARRKARDLLATHVPVSLDEALDARLRSTFDIRLPREALGPQGGTS